MYVTEKLQTKKTKSIPIHKIPHYDLQLTIWLSNLSGLKFFVCLFSIGMWHSHLNDVEIYETTRFPKGFELGTTLS